MLRETKYMVESIENYTRTTNEKMEEVLRKMEEIIALLEARTPPVKMEDYLP